MKITIIDGENTKVIEERVETTQDNKNKESNSTIDIKAKVINNFDENKKEEVIKSLDVVTTESEVNVSCKITEDNENEDVIEVNLNAENNDMPTEVFGSKVVEIQEENTEEVIKVKLNENNEVTEVENETMELIEEYQEKNFNKNNNSKKDKQNNKNKLNDLKEIINNKFIPNNNDEDDEF